MILISSGHVLQVQDLDVHSMYACEPFIPL